MWWKQSAKLSIQCNRVRRTEDRPGSEGTYIVRLSPTDRRQLGVRDGAYLKVSYGKASVLACLSEDSTQKDKTIRIDQTLRHAICLQKIMQEDEELVYEPGGNGSLEHPIVIHRSDFPGRSLLARMLKQQYLICILHHAIARDMEKPIARLTEESMADIGIQPGDKVLLISEHGRRKSIRCLALNAKPQLPLESMYEPPFTPLCPREAYKDLLLPWITVDLQTRRKLGIDPREPVNPWEPIIVGRDPYHALASEFNHVAAPLALSALGGAIVVPVEKLTFLGWFAPFVPFAIVVIGLFAVVMLILFKIRSRI